MRYYDLTILDESGKAIRHYGSLANGVYDPGTLMIEFDIQRFGESTPQGGSHVTLWGISQKEMQQATQDLFNKRMRLRAGMSTGLPLANPTQQSVILDGYIWQVYGNWVGTEIRLDFVVMPGPYVGQSGAALPAINLTLPWNKGTELSVALTQCFQTLNKFAFDINISDRLVNNYDYPMFCGSLSEMAVSLNAISKSIITTPGYKGVDIVMISADKIRVFDNAKQLQASSGSAPVTQAKVIQINPVDLVGQPTWVGFGTVSVQCVLRGDVMVGDAIRLPAQSRATLTDSSYSQYKNSVAFTGVFRVSSVRILGNSRQADGASWMTIIEAYPLLEKTA